MYKPKLYTHESATTNKTIKKILATSQSTKIWKERKYIFNSVWLVGGSLGGIF